MRLQGGVFLTIMNRGAPNIIPSKMKALEGLEYEFNNAAQLLAEEVFIMTASRKSKTPLTPEERARREAKRVAKFKESMAKAREERRHQFASVSRWAEADKPQPGLTDADRERIATELRLNAKDAALIDALLQSRRTLNHQLYNLKNPMECYLPKQGDLPTICEDLPAFQALARGYFRENPDGTVTIDVEGFTADCARREGERAESAARLKEAVESIKNTAPLPLRKRKNAPQAPDKPADQEGRVQ